MDAKKLLKKFGWCEGEGLGKNKDGLAEPLKVYMKRDNGGVGFKPSREFSDDWWCHVFDEAAKNISIESGEDGVAIKRRKKKSACESLSSKQHAHKKSRLKYGGFLESSAVVVDSKLQKLDKDKMLQEEEGFDKKMKRLSDEELFAACGGRTAHKAARHGFKLSGKIQRLLHQEEEGQDKVFVKESSPCDSDNYSFDSRKRKHDHFSF